MEAQQEAVHPPTLEEKPPAFVVYYVEMITYIYSMYGWYIFGACIALFFIWKKLQPIFLSWKRERDEHAYAAQYHKNPDLMRARQQALGSARRRMQEEHDRQAAIQAEKAIEKENQKREEWLARQAGSSSGGQKLGKDSFRPDYNPLMGPGGSGGYRAPKRSCPGGGCGK